MYLLQKGLDPLVPNLTTVYKQCDAEKIKCPLKSSAKNMQSNGQPFNFWTFCRAKWALNSGSKELITYFH
jgi:hypothetical protein